jgi:iron(III) transport system ATP-binding protein
MPPTAAPTPTPARAPTSTAIQISHLSKTFPPSSNVKAATAVNDISLSIAPGELFFLLGPSGCGKTTLLRMIAGFIEPTKGQILFADSAAPAAEAGSESSTELVRFPHDERNPLASPNPQSAIPNPQSNNFRDVTFLPPNRRNTGMVFQSYALWPHMTVAENVAFGLDIRKVPAEEKNRRVMEALEAVRMQEYAQRKPNQLSGGQQQRIALARALVIRPSVLLLDEPLSNLDAKLRIELRSEIRRVCKSTGITTIYVTHDQKEALSMADRVAILERGRVVQVGTPEGLYRHPASRFVAEFLGETNILPAKISRVSEQEVTLDTHAGPLIATSRAHFNIGEQVLLSIRPEAFAPTSPTTADGANTLMARILDSTYLGDQAQHTIELQGGVLAKMATLNPGATRGQLTSVRIAADDVVLLPVPEDGAK